MTTPDPDASINESTPPETSDKTFTQADLDRIVQDRLNRDRAKFADYDDLKAKATKLDELEQANKTELEKLLARAEEAEKRAAEASERAIQSARRVALVSAATAAGAVDPDAVLKLVDADALTIGDDGQVTGAEEAVKALLESKPYLVGSNNNTPAPRGAVEGGPRGSGSPKQLSRDDLRGMTPEQVTEAWRAGQLVDVQAAS
jgi:hypothetical protein